ncbi:MAG: 4-hydroxy-tetrahydrodipicolinate reductase [Bdellovibrionales bacterium]
MNIKIGITGCAGRVGSVLIGELQSGDWNGLELIGGTDRDIAKYTDAKFFTTTAAGELFTRADVLIDFTRPEATMTHADLAAKHGKALIVGTTGLTKDNEAKLHQAAQKTPIVYAANMSVGVNILLALVEKAAAALGPENWDIEIFESHHKHKVDAPSGTALAIGKAAASGRNVDLDDVKVTARSGITGERETGSIGFSVARGGDVVGEHTAYFYSAGERIELSHIATNRALFARGALQAAKWINGKPAGLYSMRDVLGL